MIFALDVGTRTVMGLVLEVKDKSLEIIAAEMQEHEGRAMLDGQIQDIPEVARVVKSVKEKLEEKIGKKLTKVSVAAAGRALKTIKTSAYKECNYSNAVKINEIYALQLQGLQNAQKQLTDDNEVNYYCVGYSVKNYKLDGNLIQNLLGQFGNAVELEMIATFLPRVVIDSLHSVLNSCDLIIENLTLEPIAASHLIIEPGMRKLNLALVDIGAGTSDIAVSEGGSMIGYGMVPSAGDKITETISDKVLADFYTAEKIKRELSIHDSVKFTDVLGMEQKEKSRNIIKNIRETVDTLAEKICEEIIKLNGKTPAAVLCIGGGSQTPGLAESIAEKLELSKERVAVRDSSALKNIEGLPDYIKGPECITPCGIAFTQWQGEGVKLEFIEVNDKMVRVFGDNNLKVLDVLYAAGIQGSSIYGRPGRGITIEVNKKLKLVPGESAEVAAVKVNDQKVDLDSIVKQGDNISFEAAKKGKDAQIKLADIIPHDLNKTIYFNNDKIIINPKIYVNGKAAADSIILEDNDKVDFQGIDTVYDLLKYCNFKYKNGAEIYINDNKALLDSKIKNKDRISIYYKKHSSSKDIKKENNKFINVTVNDTSIKIKGESAVLTDIFSGYDFSTTPPAGKKKLCMFVNGNNATFLTPIKENDKIEIIWK